MGTKFCSSCGKPIDPGALFCAHCGAKQGAPRQAPPAAAPEPYAPAPPQGKPPKKIWPLVTALSVIGVAVVAVLALMLLGVIKLGGAAPVVADPTPAVTATPPVQTATPAVTSAPDIAQAMVGRWEYTDPNGVTYGMEFESDGTCSFWSSGDPDVFTGTYTFDGTLLTIDEDGPTQADRFSVIMGDGQFTLTNLDTGETGIYILSKKRRRPPPEPCPAGPGIRSKAVSPACVYYGADKLPKSDNFRLIFIVLRGRREYNFPRLHAQNGRHEGGMGKWGPDSVQAVVNR